MPPSTPAPALERYDRDDFFSSLPAGGQGVLDDNEPTTGVRTITDAGFDIDLQRDTIENLGAFEGDFEAYEEVTEQIRTMTKAALAPGKLPEIDDPDETTQVGFTFNNEDMAPQGSQDIDLIRPDLEDLDFD